jgi:hypothetical protein
MEIFDGCQSRFGNATSPAYLEPSPASHRMPMVLSVPLPPLSRALSSHARCTGVAFTMAGMLALAGNPAWVNAQPSEPTRQLIRETVYNELQDHNRHGYWRYWVQQRVQSTTRLEEQVETADGPVTHLLQTNGHPVDAQTREEERARLERLMNSPQELASHRKDYVDDEKHVALIMALLPEAYVFEFAGDENGCHHLRFRPSPTYVPRSLEARVAHAMSGDLWIDARMKRLSRLDGYVGENVDFGFGLLGRLDKGGWFRVQRVQVSPTEWKTQRLELHLSGRAVLFKTIARDTNELRGGFAAVPAGTNLAQGMRILEQADPRPVPSTLARIAPVSLSTRR